MGEHVLVEAQFEFGMVAAESRFSVAAAARWPCILPKIFIVRISASVRSEAASLPKSLAFVTGQHAVYIVK